MLKMSATGCAQTVPSFFMPTNKLDCCYHWTFFSSM